MTSPVTMAKEETNVRQVSSIDTASLVFSPVWWLICAILSDRSKVILCENTKRLKDAMRKDQNMKDSHVKRQ